MDAHAETGSDAGELESEEIPTVKMFDEGVLD